MNMLLMLSAVDLLHLPSFCANLQEMVLVSGFGFWFWFPVLVFGSKNNSASQIILFNFFDFRFWKKIINVQTARHMHYSCRFFAICCKKKFKKSCSVADLSTI
jgi:hypothetical protein